ncbi:hypothetical protein [Mesorhizobium sp.]|nr:hypothetical protein [Mesorhizobium sp.]
MHNAHRVGLRADSVRKQRRRCS